MTYRVVQDIPGVVNPLVLQRGFPTAMKAELWIAANVKGEAARQCRVEQVDG